MKLLDVNHVSVRYGDLTIVNDVSFSLESGQWLMLIGPNGAGKSTIVNAISQGNHYTGNICYLDRDIRKMKPHVLAQNIGILSQHHSVGYSFTVEEVVRLGRYSYAPSIFSGKSDADETSVEEAMKLTGIASIAGQSVLTLSGGELQRTFLAQLFAQNPKILILDEPTNHLDLVYQKQIFALIRQWLDKGDRAVISVVHDLSLARAYGSHALLLHHGNAKSYGPVEQVFTSAKLNEAYGMDVPAFMQQMLSQWT